MGRTARDSETETGWRFNAPREAQDRQQAHRSPERGMGQISFKPLRRNQPSSFQSSETITFCCVSHFIGCPLCYISPGKLIHHRKVICHFGDCLEAPCRVGKADILAEEYVFLRKWPWMAKAGHKNKTSPPPSAFMYIFIRLLYVHLHKLSKFVICSLCILWLSTGSVSSCETWVPSFCPEGGPRVEAKQGLEHG